MACRSAIPASCRDERKTIASRISARKPGSSAALSRWKSPRRCPTRCAQYWCRHRAIARRRRPPPRFRSPSNDGILRIDSMAAREAAKPTLNETPRSQLLLEPADSRRLARLCGQYDEHLHLIEQRLGVRISNRGNHFTIEGSGCEKARELIQHLYDETARHLELTPEQVHLKLQ